MTKETKGHRTGSASNRVVRGDGRGGRHRPGDRRNTGRCGRETRAARSRRSGLQKRPRSVAGTRREALAIACDISDAGKRRIAQSSKSNARSARRTCSSTTRGCCARAASRISGSMPGTRCSPSISPATCCARRPSDAACSRAARAASCTSRRLRRIIRRPGAAHTARARPASRCCRGRSPPNGGRAACAATRFVPA